MGCNRYFFDVPKSQTASIDIREACVIAARNAIAEHGVQNLSLRDVARRLGVSHQAPYKHYANRDVLLAEVMRRCFQNFATYLDARAESTQPHEDLSAMGQAYLEYARANPLEYQLMFNTPWPEAAEHPELVRDAQHAFGLLKASLKRTHPSASKADIELDAMFIWATLHGISTIMQSSVTESLALSKRVLAEAPLHALRRIGTGISEAR